MAYTTWQKRQKRKWKNLFSSFYNSMYEAMLSSYEEKCWLWYTNLWSLPAPSLWATSKTWTQTLDPGTEHWKTWTLKNLDLEKPGPWETWTLKNLDTEKLGHWKTWTLKNLDLEKHGKRLAVEKWLEEHIL